MKIATYNLQLGGKASQRVHWHRIFEVAKPDIFLVQETCHSSQYAVDIDRDRVCWTKVKNNSWGSAVCVRSGTVNPISIPEFEGCIVGVEVDAFAWSATQGRKLRVFSLHVPAPYKSSVNRMLDWKLFTPTRRRNAVVDRKGLRSSHTL